MYVHIEEPYVVIIVTMLSMYVQCSILYSLVIRCPRSTPLLNGDVVVLDRKVGSTVNYSCHSEYILFGPSTRNCSVLGTWTGNAPVCLSMQEQ